MPLPRFASALSTAKESKSALDEAVRELDQGLKGETPDLVVAFATHHHGAALEKLGPRLVSATGCEVVIGCTAESVIGGTREVEGSPGVALWAAHLPATDVRFFEAHAWAAEGGEPEFSAFPNIYPDAESGADAASRPGGSSEDAKEAQKTSVLLLADPFSFPVDPYLTQLNERFPGVPVMGGLASGAMGPGQSLFFTSDGVRDGDCVGVVLDGEIELRPVVSQGCRPVGKPWVITDCKQNHIKKLGGRPALEVLMETWQALSAGDQSLLQSAPFLGLAIDPARSRFDRGDFLTRGIMGLNQADRTIAVADFVRRGQTVQLLVRDAESAGEDLLALMSEQGGGALESMDTEYGPTAGALIFSCSGRGKRMFGAPDHDISRVHEGLSAEVPAAGFFAAGEIGPIGGRNFLHGFTASVAIFRPRAPSGDDV